jgi:predicted CoA-binding protein
MESAAMGEDRVDNERLRDLLLNTVRTIAVVGIKAGENDDAFRVPRYMQAQGYQIVPISQKLEAVLGEPVFRSLSDLDAPVDLVNLFRASDHIPAHTDEILSMPTLPKMVWMQLGIRNEASAARLRDAGVVVIEDRCLMVDHRNLSASGDLPVAGSRPTDHPGEQ